MSCVVSFSAHVICSQTCVNEAAAQLCRHRPTLLTRRDDLFNLSLRIVKESGFQALRPAGSAPSYR